MGSNELQTTEQQTTAIELPKTAAQIRYEVNLIQGVLKEVMKPDVHYGIIPGCKEPSLYKPGAEKIAATFRLAVDPIVEDLRSDDGEIRYRVTCRLISTSGVFVGAGIGECSSLEKKYKWQKAYDDVWNDTPENQRRIQPGKYKNKQVRIEPADIANTILKMAKKRAMVDAILTATAASDVFKQDIEDLPEGFLDGDAGQAAAPAVATPQRRSAAKDKPAKSAPASAPAAQEAKPATDPGTPATGELTAGMVKVLNSKMVAAGVTPEQFERKFSCPVEKLDKSRINEAMEWATSV